MSHLEKKLEAVRSPKNNFEKKFTKNSQKFWGTQQFWGTRLKKSWFSLGVQPMWQSPSTSWGDHCVDSIWTHREKRKHSEILQKPMTAFTSKKRPYHLSNSYCTYCVCIYVCFFINWHNRNFKMNYIVFWVQLFMKYIPYL